MATLIDYRTGDCLREATEAEIEASKRATFRAVTPDGREWYGVIEVDGRHCYVEESIKWTVERVPEGVVCYRLTVGDVTCIVTRGDDSEWFHWSVERDEELERGYSRSLARAQAYALEAALEASAAAETPN